jgi:hypothetical protein
VAPSVRHQASLTPPSIRRQRASRFVISQLNTAGSLSLSFIRAHDGRTMGDKSPKSKHKQADQKQNKTDENSRKKQAAVSAKQVATKKK